MRWGQLLLCGWPGLARLWLRGSYPALLLAIGYSILLNLALVSTFLWPALLGNTFPLIAWPILLTAWLVSALISFRMIGELSAVPPMAADQERSGFSVEKGGKSSSDCRSDLAGVVAHTLFNRAQREYLRGHWSETESLLKRQLQQSERDIEARLLLASLYRRTGRLDEALEQLNQIARFDDSVHWSFEMDRERQLIACDRGGNPSTDGK